MAAATRSELLRAGCKLSRLIETLTLRATPLKGRKVLRLNPFSGAPTLLRINYMRSAWAHILINYSEKAHILDLHPRFVYKLLRIAVISSFF